MKVLLPLLLLCVFLLPLGLRAASNHAPALMLANTWRPDIPLHHYWISEKLDGVRAYWDGQQLRTRSGYPIQTPLWFTADFPTQPLDGELWLGRGRFDEVSALVRSDNIADTRWDDMRYMVFDLPALKQDTRPASFEQRRLALQRLVEPLQLRQLQLVRHFRLPSDEALQQALQTTVQKGGEGLMLYRADALYRARRSDAVVKLKPAYDAEAVVVGYVPGKGKYRGLTGSLRVKTPDGVLFRVGSGLSDSERRNPPPVGAVITYAYSGKTGSGKPRFPRFLRVRHPE